ncbi:hypothetical protein Pmani_035811 [Petrolisthes manimaculis]|uniref:Uncharacterized protein n=1 Tax=Petrolisthes manimaculis TaxID=1843537 RepID=A0AAE1NJU1_9EUCA|nr:hypothetical protein Pmani_035811 [Petrolisthes manimaculis]
MTEKDGEKKYKTDDWIENVHRQQQRKERDEMVYKTNDRKKEEVERAGNKTKNNNIVYSRRQMPGREKDESSGKQT